MTLEIKKISSTQGSFWDSLKSATSFSAVEDPKVKAVVEAILATVRDEGDPALLRYTAQFDRYPVGSIGQLSVSPANTKKAFEHLDSVLQEDLITAAERIERFHERQVSPSWEFQDEWGNRLGQRVTPLDSVGIYAPGGKALYPSSILMNAIPAKVAGVTRRVLVVPTPNGEVSPLILATAHLAGVHEVYTIGGAQAIAALAYGTQTIGAVDKIVGPGNAYVASAKRQVFGVVGIDMIAGPSEIMVVADENTNPEWLAMDLFSQAEHDECAQSILVSTSWSVIESVEKAIESLLPSMQRKEIIATSLANRGMLIHVESLNQAAEIVNTVAPEHLELCICKPEAFLASVRHAGAIFIGPLACETMGDYVMGPSHVLPTSRSARFSSPLGVYDFQKKNSIIEVSCRGIAELAPVAERLALSEQLPAHAAAARLRINNFDGTS